MKQLLYAVIFLVHSLVLGGHVYTKRELNIDIDKQAIQLCQESSAEDIASAGLTFYQELFSPGPFYYNQQGLYYIDNEKVLRGICLMSSSDITNILVHRSMRRQGVADKLIKKALQLLTLMGCKKTELQVRPGNTAALSFYTKHGYVIQEEGESYVWMVRDLSSYDHTIE